MSAGRISRNSLWKREECKKISELAVKSLLYEVAVTPKPGLVDRNNSGAHDDMDFYTFIDSALSLKEIFDEMTYVGYTYRGKELTDLFNILRKTGIKGERKLFSVTKGVNTHKGALFSMGISCAAIGYLIQKYQQESIEPLMIRSTINKISEGLCQRDFLDICDREAKTHGEIIYRKYGVKGIRGEVEAGFPIIFEESLPYINRYKEHSLNDLLVNVLLVIMSKAEDSNILWRHNMNVLKEVQDNAEEILKIGGMFNEAGKEKLCLLDQQYIKHRISPGGSADLLAVSIFLGSFLKII